MIRFNNILFKSTLLVDLFSTSLISTNQNTQVSTAWARLEGIKAVRQRGELSTGQTWGDSCPLGVASLYKLLEQDPTVKREGVTNPAEIRDSTDILFTIKWESGRNKHEGRIGMECSENEPYPAPSSHRRSTGSGKKWLGFQTDLLHAAKRHLRFSGLLDTTLRPDRLQMQTEHTTVTTTKAVRMIQSLHYRYAFRHQCGTPRQGVLKDTVVS